MQVQKRKQNMEKGFDQIKTFIYDNLEKNCRKCSNNKNIVLFEPLTDECEEVGIVFLGLSPGEAEWKAGHPFASEEDQLCRKMFKEQGLMECGILLFNACCCMHTPDHPPADEEIYYCFDNFEKALELIPDRAVIVPTGAPSLRRMGIIDNPETAMNEIYTYEVMQFCRWYIFLPL
ncbi:uracil-DNA glycosylase family protein [Clostridium sp. AM58-1XD]|uniref:uracil-DNA glycosylase family protein n=1 Tax=Clostridium sp. AM58-1XD TaxID=2292307 RepID=UPI000E516A88|nr:uracil-DNA glycosylase family protein [Clostridium sp. AM58-1XD]RGY96191.1 hypothetical protein DXA13_17700 [Clostridium sp. AM58-1XD]